VIHCLVQAVVKDEMSDADLTTLHAMIVDICDRSFPREWDKSHALSRTYVGQVMGLVIDADASETEKSANVMDRVGWFLREDGKIFDSERLLLRSMEKWQRILGGEHPDTFTSMNNLAITYRDQGMLWNMHLCRVIATRAPLYLVVTVTGYTLNNQRIHIIRNSPLHSQQVMSPG
jgi:hypothetical protein